jgi:hypothetical protein
LARRLWVRYPEKISGNKVMMSNRSEGPGTIGGHATAA